MYRFQAQSEKVLSTLREIEAIRLRLFQGKLSRRELRYLEGKLARRLSRLSRRLHRLMDLEHHGDHESHHEWCLNFEQQINEINARLVAIENEVRNYPNYDQQIAQLSAAVTAIQNEQASGNTPNPGLQQTFAARAGTTASVTTTGGTVTGVVLQAGTNAVAIREATGDIVMIPFASITAVA